MYVKIGPYTDWVGPYQIAEKILFWKDKYSDTVHNFGTRLATNKNGGNSKLMDFCLWINSKKKRKEKIKIHNYDIWSMDRTLAIIILPMLKLLRENKHGSPIVDLEDVPENLRFSQTENYEDQKCFDWYHDDKKEDPIHERWEWVMNEMIWAFEQIVDDSWEEKYTSGVSDIRSEPCSWDENGKPTLYTMKEGPNHTYKMDHEGMERHSNRIQNGLRLLGKYYRSLWD